jgi:small subunit ribosomal protein S11
MASPKRSSGKSKKREKKNIPEGIVYIQSTFNNTIVTIADKQGDVISWSSSGCLGFKGSRKSTPFAAQKAVAEAAKKAMDHGMRKVEVKVKSGSQGERTRAWT